LTPAYEMKTQPLAPNGASTFAPGTSAPGRNK
jgi:hypothetical protein